MAKVVVFGDKALDRKLASLGPKLANQIARKAMRRSAKGVMQSAKETVGVDTGELRDSLNIKAVTRSRTRIGVKVQTEEDGKGYGGAYIEFGTKHLAAQPFLRPALYDNAESIRQQIIADVYTIIWEKSFTGRTFLAASKRGKKFKKKFTKLKKNTSRRLKKAKKNTTKRLKKGRKSISRRLKKAQKFVRSKSKKLAKRVKKVAKQRRSSKKKSQRRPRKR